MAEKGYEGKITNSGAQLVTALHRQPKTKDAAKIHTGKDLRGNAGSKR